MMKHLLIVNLHSSANAGDHALTLESLRQLRAAFPEAHITCAYNDPARAEPGVETVPSFFNWVRFRRTDGTPAWRLWQGPPLIATALLAGLVYRLSGRLPRLWLSQEQYALLRAYARADAVISSAGNVFYSSGTGLNLLLNFFTFGYGLWMGKPLATLPQSFGPLQREWERWLLGQVGRRARLLLAREPVSARLLAEAGVPEGRRRLAPDIAFAFTQEDAEGARVLLSQIPGVTGTPLLGITMIHWGAQNRAFKGQQQYEAAVRATIERFLAETDGQVLLFAQVWGPTPAEDDRVPARRVAAAFERSGRVHAIEREMHPALLRSCYARLDLLLGTRMHSNIFALSAGVPVVAVGYLTKTAGIMEMLSLNEWVLEIGAATEATLPQLVMRAWKEREGLRREARERVPALVKAAAGAAGLVKLALAGAPARHAREVRG